MINADTLTSENMTGTSLVPPIRSLLPPPIFLLFMCLSEMLGTKSNNPDINYDHIAGLAPDAKSRDEEVASIGVDAVAEKTRTVFSRDEDGTPMIWDYQVKGFIKEATRVRLEMGTLDAPKKPYLSQYTVGRVMGTGVAVTPRRLRLQLPPGGQISLCERPLRAVTIRGERVCLASSESVPEGTTWKCQIQCQSWALVPVVLQALQFGEFVGVGQWRTGGKGAFKFQVLNEPELAAAMAEHKKRKGAEDDEAEAAAPKKAKAAKAAAK